MEHSIFDPIIAGIFCCVAMDVWQRILFLMFNIPPTNWSTTGRWFMMLISKKIIFNQNLDHENPVKYELQIGWAFHYWVAIVYGFAYYFLLAVFNILDTSILSGLIFGLISVIVPWFFYLPVTGKGFMGNKTPNPTLTKLLSTSSHVVVGVFLAIGFSLLGY
ncbi:MAG: DUF2938 domain-containing protein [Rhodobacteraceae bacterium]|nr:DUF2938 domain-containing protein [Paracoccaceae bacterium]